MSLGTFGAVMGFASEMVRRSMQFYRSGVEKAKDPILKEALQLLCQEESRNCSLLEQTRRENVTEMILEPITGLKPEDYEMAIGLSPDGGDEELFKAALVMEERERRFFQDSSQKIPLPEVARVFRKAARKKEENLAKLKSLR